MALSVRWRESELIDGDQISICFAHVIIEKVSHPMIHRQDWNIVSKAAAAYIPLQIERDRGGIPALIPALTDLSESESVLESCDRFSFVSLMATNDFRLLSTIFGST